jgi:hypothetical protein
MGRNALLVAGRSKPRGLDAICQRLLPDCCLAPNVAALVDNGPGRRHAPVGKRQPVAVIDGEQATRLQPGQNHSDACLTIVTVDKSKGQRVLRKGSCDGYVAWLDFVQRPRFLRLRMVQRHLQVMNVVNASLSKSPSDRFGPTRVVLDAGEFLQS